MPPRLGHKKSRNGCVSCKRRRVKCDEQRPCGACVRYGWQCSLTAEASPAASSEYAGNNGLEPLSATTQKPLPTVFEPHALPDSTPIVSPSGSNDQQSAQTSLWLEDLELMHHFSTSTWRTMHHSQYSLDIWQHTVPQIACKHEYLMHGLLAVTALHVAYLQPAKQRDYYIVSTSHQNHAIQGFRNAINTVTRENADAIFLASILIASFAFASTVAKSNDSQESFTLSDVAEILILIRGIEETLSAGITRRWVLEGPLGLMLQVPQGPPDDAGIPEERLIFLPHLVELHRLVERRAEEMPPHVVVSLNEALDQLDTTYRVMSWVRPMQNSGFVMLWPNIITMSFLSLIQERHPIALVILAYFCAMMHYHDERWIWDSWGARVTELIIKNLDADWQKWIEWPANVIEKNMKYEELET